MKKNKSLQTALSKTFSYISIKQNCKLHQINSMSNANKNYNVDKDSINSSAGSYVGRILARAQKQLPTSVP